ncbi:hypothetical protein H5410_028080 [Solanum commersonii]|uniref:Uncharacterized protein n=1 Tax=Solanum commersonii TaxID=4109 RepID=A0A9J5Z572_SOLCO|nr:hypothetical protein H5410_028080 [Solanum commersonii]
MSTHSVGESEWVKVEAILHAASGCSRRTRLKRAFVIVDREGTKFHPNRDVDRNRWSLLMARCNGFSSAPAFSMIQCKFLWNCVIVTVSSVYDLKPLLSLKKTFFCNFYSSKVEEEACKVNNTPYVVTRELIERRDIYPPSKIDLKNPWQIKIKITSYEVEARGLLIPYIETLKYILRYWTLDMAKALVNGCGVRVQVRYVTMDNAPKKYKGKSVYLWKLYNDDYALSCIELFNNSRLGVGGKIGLFWDPRSSNFMFKLLSQDSPRIYDQK